MYTEVVCDQCKKKFRYISSPHARRKRKYCDRCTKIRLRKQVNMRYRAIAQKKPLWIKGLHRI